MKTLVFLLIATIIVFFLWNILKRIFFKQFYNHFPTPPQNKTENKSSKKVEKKLNWDAETVDYEEISNEKSAEKKSKN